MVSLVFMASVLALMALFRASCQWTWPAVYWVHWILFVMMFVVFVLDADGLNSGCSSCKSDFEVDVGTEEPVSIWYTESDYKCDVTPFLWTVFLDLMCSITSYAVYKVATLYASSCSGSNAADKVTGTTKQESSVKTQPEPESNGSTTSSAAGSASPASVDPHTGIAVGGDTQHHIQSVSGTDGNAYDGNGTVYGNSGG